MIWNNYIMFAFWFIVFSTVFAGVSANTVWQFPSENTAEGQQVTLICNHTIRDFNFIAWYKQIPGLGLQLCAHGVSTANNLIPRYTMTIDRSKLTSELHITNVQGDDTAVYYCAVRGTTGYKFFFGSGTRLVIKPKTQKQTPYVYKLKLKSSESVNNLPNSVCLITDFPSPNKTLNIDGEVVDLNVMAVLDNSTNNVWRYSTVIWNNNNKDVTCNGTYDDNDFSDTGNTEETCSSSVSIDENFKTNPSLNTIPVTVLGLRILTAKAIVFNLIITARLWSY